MVSYRSVLQTVEAALGPDGRRGKQLTAAQRGDLFYALSLVEDDLRSDNPPLLFPFTHPTSSSPSPLPSPPFPLHHLPQQTLPHAAIPVGEYLACALLVWFGIRSIQSALKLPAATPMPAAAAAAAPAAGSTAGAGEGDEEEGELAEAREFVEKAEAEKPVATSLEVFWEAFSLIFLAVCPALLRSRSPPFNRQNGETDQCLPPLRSEQPRSVQPSSSPQPEAYSPASFVFPMRMLLVLRSLLCPSNSKRSGTTHLVSSQNHARCTSVPPPCLLCPRIPPCLLCPQSCGGGDGGHGGASPGNRPRSHRRSSALQTHIRALRTTPSRLSHYSLPPPPMPPCPPLPCFASLYTNLSSRGGY
ncbi:unnamed protein product [Closterium sp. NIES-54]